MGWLSFLKSKDFDPAVFEKELAALSSKISKNERTIASFKYQERQSKTFVIVYGTVSYLLTLLYFLVKNGLAFGKYKYTELGIIVSGPILLVLITKLIKFYYFKRIQRIENYVEQLRSQHQEKIEELKAKTNFQSTQALLNRFADGGDVNAHVDEELLEKQKQLEEIKQLSLQGNNEAQRFNAYPGMQVHHHWYDSIIDLVVGTDELSPNNRYALICINCSSHNGLAPPGRKPEYVKYICPRCGVLNGRDPDPSLPVTQDFQEHPDEELEEHSDEELVQDSNWEQSKKVN